MEGPMESALRYFLPGDCYQTVVEDFNFSNVQCWKLFYSRILSLTVLAGAVIVKVPQILKIVRASSAEGLSYVAIILELLAVSFTCTYNYGKGFNFSLWGESFFISVQVIILLFLMFYYNKNLSFLVVMVPIYVGGVWYLVSGYASLEVLGVLQTCVIPLLVTSRLTQIHKCYSNKSTGQLSLITSFMNWAGTATRIYTVAQETQDTIMLLLYISTFTLNSIILLQFLLYRGADTDRSKTAKTD